MSAPTSTRRIPNGRTRSASMSAPLRRLPRNPPAFVKRSFFAAKPFLRPTWSQSASDPIIPRTGLPKEQAVFGSNASVALPASLEPLDLPPVQISLPCLRDVFLSDLNELETRLSDLDNRSSPHPTDVLEEGAAFVKDGLEFLEWLKAEVGTHIPDFDFDFDLTSGVRSRLPDFPGVGSTFDVRSKLSHTFDDARTRFSHIDLSLPSLPGTKEYSVALQERLSTIRDRLLAVSLPLASDLHFPSLSPPQVLTDLLPDLLGKAEEEDDDAITPISEREAQVRKALEASCNGIDLIRYDDLPFKWKNNEHIHYGYRFIPLSSWKSLVLSVFKIHNETANIHTHLLPLLSIISLALPFIPFPQIVPSAVLDLLPTHTFHLPSIISSSSLLEVDPVPRYMFLIAAATCLACSSLWHLSSGCSDVWVLETGARTDYVGIGWLISASVASIVYYGFNCHPIWMAVYIGLSIATGIAGSVAPFQTWFDERKNKMKRVAFFLVLAGSSILPNIHLAYIKGIYGAIHHVAPVMPSIAAYLIGLTFYATHFPECLFPGRFDYMGSHAVWHTFIVLAVRAHWQAMEVLQMRAVSNICS